MKTRYSFVVLLLVAACTKPQGSEQDLIAYVDTLSAIDSHAHPLAYVAPEAPADTDFDALPLDGIPPFDLPAPLLASNPAYRDAQVSLYGVRLDDTESVRAAARDAAVREHGDQFPSWVLDKLHIQTMLANRVAMGAGLPSSRFRWVSFADALMYPLDTRAESERTLDTKALYPLEAKLLRRYLGDLGLKSIPSTLDDYLRKVVTATLERQHDAGAIAVKFEAAYLRPLDFALADSASAATVYARYARGGVPSHNEYKTLEDYLIRYIAREAGRLGMAIQIHSLNQFGGHYSAEGAAPHLMDSMFGDSTLKSTSFVIIHGGWPRIDETLVQLKKPNVFTDMSMMDQLADSAALADAMKSLLKSAPEKIMFGTDAFDGGALQGWEQIAWVASHNGRRALASALSEMVQSNEISNERAMQLARMVLRDNAVHAYRLSPDR